MLRPNGSKFSSGFVQRPVRNGLSRVRPNVGLGARADLAVTERGPCSVSPGPPCARCSVQMCSLLGLQHPFQLHGSACGMCTKLAAVKITQLGN